ncbi:MAG: hypothetical protein ACKPKO_47350, partial [Candidatus Fonsibacter sp.]
SAGVGELAYKERVNRAVAPPMGPKNPVREPSDIVSVAKKAAQAAAIAASEHSQSNKAYAKLGVARFPIMVR